MNLDVFERLVLQGILPQEGSYITLKLVRKLRESLSFSEKEIADIDFRNHWICPKCQKVDLSADVIKCPDCALYMKPAGQVTWDEQKAKGVVKDVHMGAAMATLCVTVLKKLSDEEQLKEHHISLYEKFVKYTAEEGALE